MSNEKTPSIFGFYGFSRSGKTTLLHKLVRHLTQEGFRVAVLKKTAKAIRMDQQGKDTAQFAQAGAGLVVFSSALETAFIEKHPSQTGAILSQMKAMGEWDFIFIEGANDPQVPKIRIGGCPERANTLFTYDGDFRKLLQTIKLRTL